MLTRRTVLKGSCLALLPMLESLLPRTAKAAAAGPLRFVGMYAPNGIIPSLWRPTALGSTFDLPLSLQPLASVRQKVSVISNMRLGADDNMGSHEGGLKLFLTASRLATATSIDQVIGKLSESTTALRTLNLGLENNGYWWPSSITPSHAPTIDLNNIDLNDTAVYTSTDGADRQVRCSDNSCIASVANGTAQANVYHPQVAFEKLFGSASSTPSGGTGTGVDPAVLKAAARRRRVVDAIKGHASSLKTKVSSTDAARVDEYLEGVRRIEVELDKIQGSSGTGSGVSAACDRTTAVSGIPVALDRYAKLMCDLIVRAFQCDATRAATYMLGQCVSPMSFTVDGVTYSHHGDASHSGTDPVRMHAKGVIDSWQVSIFAYLVDKLSKVTDADGTALIDRTAIYYGSDVADSNLHDAVNMPVLLGGTLGGALHPGSHIDGKNTTVGNLFVAILAAFGVTGKFGEFGTAAMGGI